MFDETNHTSGKSLQYRFGAVQIYFDSDQVFQRAVTKLRRDKVDFDIHDTANESAVLVGAPAAAYERAVQALRDVRHLLPAEDVAIVDAVLDSINVRHGRSE
jgi:hypothetical protein